MLFYGGAVLGGMNQCHLWPPVLGHNNNNNNPVGTALCTQSGIFVG